MDPAPRPMVLRYMDGRVSEAPDELAAEEPLEIRVRGRAISVTMRTPGEDEELAAGFLVSEGVVKGPGDVVRIEPCGRNEFGNVLNVVLAPEVAVDFEKLTRHVFASSSCGLCGKASIDAVRTRATPVKGDIQITAAALQQLPLAMRQVQETFTRTGG